MPHTTPFALLLAALSTAACANYSQLQDAETLPVGEQRIGLGMSYTRYTARATDENDNTITESVEVPALVLWARRGVTERLEAQATAWLPLGARAGAKVQLLGKANTQGPHLSIGAQVGFLRLSASSGDAEASVQFFDAYLPLYAGYRFSPGFAVYVAPQYALRQVWGEGESETGHVTGATAGVAAGAKARFFFEVGSFYDTLVDKPILNTALGVHL